MSVYFCSDLHLGHKNIQKFRNFVVSEEDNRKQILLEWEQKINKHDIVYCLGDAAFTMEGLNSLNGLPGRKILVRGNHDLCDTSAYLKIFEEVYGLLKYKEFWLSHAPIHPEELRGKINLHGHVHYETLKDSRYFNCCVENLHDNFGSCFIELEILRKYLNDSRV